MSRCLLCVCLARGSQSHVERCPPTRQGGSGGVSITLPKQTPWQTRIKTNRCSVRSSVNHVHSQTKRPQQCPTQCFTRAALNHNMQASHSSDRALADRCAEGRNVCASRINVSHIMPTATYAVKRREDEIISDKKLLYQEFCYKCFQHYY